jgi:hypothetical protein
MKKILFAFVFVLAAASLALAQHVKTSTLKEDEVPVAVRISFKKDFGEIPAKGLWMVSYSVHEDGGRTAATPVAYTFIKRNKPQKIEVRYTPEGKLESVKGIEKVNTPNT